MEEINHQMLEQLKDNHELKNVDCYKNQELMVQFFYHKNNIFKFIKERFDVYQLALWIKSREFYIKRKETNYEHAYKPRDIVLIDFGDNMKSELSYKHPCVVIRNDTYNIFVVPCSSSKIKKAINKKTGKEYNEYIIGYETDGFSKPTVLILNSARWVSKSRIIERKDDKIPKQVTPDFFKKLYDKLFSFIFAYKDFKINKRINDLEMEIMYLNNYDS